MCFFVSFCYCFDAVTCGGFGNGGDGDGDGDGDGGGGDGDDILDDHGENHVERIPTRDVKCIADAPDFIAPEVTLPLELPI